MKKEKAFTLVELLVVIGIIALLLSVILPLAGVGRYQYKEIKVTDTMYELPIPYVSYWDDAIKEFGRRHDEEIVTIVRPTRDDWDKKVLITVKKKQK